MARRRSQSNLHGLLIVDKPGLDDSTSTSSSQQNSSPPEAAERSWRHPTTSHDVVQVVRRWSGQPRIGHTGTLDPLASGVLVLCLGQATRLVEYYQGHPKQYLAEIALGAATDTYDAEGEVTERMVVPQLSLPEIDRALNHFRGDIMQTPPIYSALKQGGESLHRKARRGEQVTPTPRPVTMKRIDLLEFQAPDRIVLRVLSSAGAYIRSLAHDLGHALGTRAHLTRLRREAAGPFTLKIAHPLSTIEQAAQISDLPKLLLPLGYGLTFERIQLDDESARRLGFGQQVILDADDDDGLVHCPDNPLAQAVDENGRLLGIIRCLEQDQEMDETAGLCASPRRWKAEKWFAGSGV